MPKREHLNTCHNQACETAQVNTFVKIICIEMLQEKFYRYSMKT